MRVFEDVNRIVMAHKAEMEGLEIDQERGDTQGDADERITAPASFRIGKACYCLSLGDFHPRNPRPSEDRRPGNVVRAGQRVKANRFLVAKIVLVP